METENDMMFRIANSRGPSSMEHCCEIMKKKIPLNKILIKVYLIGFVALGNLGMGVPRLEDFVLGRYNLKVLLWGVLCTSQLILRICIEVSFGAITLLVNNSVTFDKLGAVNGLAVSLTALFRTCAPSFSGAVYSTSLSEATKAIGFPLDYHLIFVIFGVVAIPLQCFNGSLPARKSQ